MYLSVDDLRSTCSTEQIIAVFNCLTISPPKHWGATISQLDCENFMHEFSTSKLDLGNDILSGLPMVEEEDCFQAATSHF